MTFQSDNGTVFVSGLTKDLISSAYLRKNFFPLSVGFFVLIQSMPSKSKQKVITIFLYSIS